MRGDELAQDSRQLVFFCKCKAISDVADDCLGTFLRIEGFVIVLALLFIFYKAQRIDTLAYVVI